MLPPQAVAEPAKDQGAEGAHDEADGVGGEGRQEAGHFVLNRKKYAGESGGQNYAEIEVVPLEDGAGGGRGDEALCVRWRRDWSFYLYDTDASITPDTPLLHAYAAA